MNTIGDCCEGPQVPQPKVEVVVPDYNALYGNIKELPSNQIEKPAMTLPQAAQKRI